MIKCIVCFKKADYILDSQSYCEKHAKEISRRNEIDMTPPKKPICSMKILERLKW